MSVAGFESFARFKRREELVSDALKSTQLVIGWRCWRVLPFQRLDGSHTFRLCAVGTYGIPKVWEPRKPVVAVCSARYETAHEAPSIETDERHQCGLWALKRSEEARRRMVQYMQTQSGVLAGWAFGQVSLWGRVIEHDRGYRAQYAYPYELTIETPDEHVARAIRDEYAVDVAWAGTELFEKAKAKRAEAAKRRTVEQEALEEIKSRLNEIHEHLSKPQGVPSQWFSVWNIPVEQLVDAVRAAQAKSDDGVATSREVCVEYALATGFAEDDCDHYRRHHDMALELKRATWGGHVLQLRQRGEGSARWCLPGTELPDSCTVKKDPHDREDAEALEALRETLKASGKDSARTRDVLAYLGRSDASMREKTMLGHALGRQVNRGNVSQATYTGSSANVWALTEQGKRGADRDA